MKNNPIRMEPWSPWPIYGKEEEQAIVNVLHSNQLFAAKQVKAFEEEFADYVGVKFAKGLGNATEGLHLALAALNIGVGDEVIVTPYSWISSASCILMQNAVPVFVDCEPDTLALDAKKVEEAITERTKAIILVHLFGYSARVEDVLNVARKYNLFLIEDASHAHGTLFKGKKAGSFGDINVFSLHQRKTLPVGDGGIITTDNEELNEKIYRLRSFGHKELSYNYRMTEFAAALGRVRLKSLDAENEIRINNAEMLGELISNVDGIETLKPIENSKSVYYRLILKFDHSKFKIDINEFVKKLNIEGIPFETTWEPLHRHPHFNPDKPPARGCPWKWQLYSGEMPDKYNTLSFPVVENLCDKTIFELVVHPPVGENEMQQAAEAIKKVAEQNYKQ